MKRFKALPILLLLAIISTLSIHLIHPTSVQAVFSDVSQDHPHYQAINYVQNQGIVRGYDDKTYRADQEINRVEFLKIVVEANYSQEEIENCDQTHQQFADTKMGLWYSPYICVGKTNGIVSGFDNGMFYPDSSINFVQASKIITLGSGATVSRSVPWYESYVQYLGEKNAIPSTLNSLEQDITRGEMAEIIYYLQSGVDQKPSYQYESFIGSNHNCIEEGCTKIKFSTDENYRHIESNGIPNHETGEFPNAGNPNTISEQDESYQISLHPEYQTQTTQVQVPGIALNGVFFEPGTAEKNGEWSYEGLQDTLNLGMDENHAHVQPTGAYHYHGIPDGLVDIVKGEGDLVHVGWAADGFPMFVSLSNHYQTSWQLKSGTRPTSPFGEYDGTYTQDFEYVANSGDLDECNGTWIDNKYVYLLTAEFPYISRCLHGKPDASFAKVPGQAGMTDGQTQNGPPQTAIDVCYAADVGEACSFSDGNGSHSGSCQNTPQGYACVPENG